MSVEYKELVKRAGDITYYPRDCVETYPECEAPTLKLTSKTVKLLEGLARGLQKSWTGIRVGTARITKVGTNKGYSHYIVEDGERNYTFDIAKIHNESKGINKHLFSLCDYMQMASGHSHGY